MAVAINETFAIGGGAMAPSHLSVCHRRMCDLMTRQRIPCLAADLRGLSDAGLYRIALLASIGGMSEQWQRDAATDAFLLDESGRMQPAFAPSQVESDVMMCIICALLGVIAIYYVALPSAD